MIADIIGQIFWFGMLATPIISFFIVRKMGEGSIVVKIIIGVVLTVFLAMIFAAIAMGIIFRDGLGPG